MKNYWLHRIKYEMPVSQHLLSKENYLTIGWKDYAGLGLLGCVQSQGDTGFDDFMKKHQNTSPNRWSLYKFLNFKKGDIVLVPIWEKVVICEVIEDVINICDMKLTKQPLQNTWTKKDVHLAATGLVDTGTGSQREYDLGFAVKVKIIATKPRKYAEAALIARMKIRQTTSNLGDLSGDIEKLLNAESTPSLYDKLLESLCGGIKSAINLTIDDTKFEDLVAWYMRRKGADYTYKPSKNDPRKTNGADADVVAIFDDLKLVFYIQVKKHHISSETNDWAVWQVSAYKNQMQNIDDEYTYISWVISLANSFTEDANLLAASNNVRLINGDEFAQMLMHVGFKNIDDIMKMS